MKYSLTYTVIIEAEDENMAELISVDLEGAIKFVDRKIVDVYCDPYVEKIDD